jgi:hypothetical protein
VALGLLREGMSRSDDGTVTNTKHWHAAKHWYTVAAGHGHKGAMCALALLYYSDLAARRVEAVDLLIRSSSIPNDPADTSEHVTCSSTPATLEQILAQVLGSRNALLPESPPNCQSSQRTNDLRPDNTLAAEPVVTYRNEMFCEGEGDVEQKHAAIYRSAYAQTDATMLWSQLQKRRRNHGRRATRRRSCLEHGASTVSASAGVAERPTCCPLEHANSGAFTPAQHLTLQGDALFFGHGERADTSGACKLYLQGMSPLRMMANDWPYHDIGTTSIAAQQC